MEYRRLCESDYRFMSVIWDNEPIQSMKLVELCRAQLGWKKSTTYTMLKKLCDKGLARNVDTIVSSLVPREDVQAAESESFVQHTFGGSLPGFLVAFLGEKTISQQEAEELKQLIDRHQQQEK